MEKSKLFDTFSGNYVPKNSEIIKDNGLIEKLRKGEYNLVIDQARYPIGSLPEVFKDYNLNPDYQRNVVWSQERKSRLIESLIVNVPIPPIFLYEVDYNRYEVMDGLQRISSITGYLQDEYALNGLELWPELQGYKFSKLPDDFKSTIKRRYLSASIIVKEANTTKEKQDQLKRFIFERLNTGGLKLTDQEIRNALYTGPLNSLINKIADKNNVFNNLVKVGKKSNEVNRMETRELVLRFFAYKDVLVNNANGETKKILDEYLRVNQNIGQVKINALSEYFIQTIDLAYRIFGENAFRKKNSTKFEKMVYDTVLLSCANLIDSNKGNIEISFNTLQRNKLKYEFFNNYKSEFNGKYTAFNNVKKRVDLFTQFLLREFFQNDIL